MIYTHEWADGKGRSTIRFNPVKIAVRLRNQHRIYVVPTTRERRMRLIDCLEAKVNGLPGRPFTQTRTPGFPSDGQDESEIVIRLT